MFSITQNIANPNFVAFKDDTFKTHYFQVMDECVGNHAWCGFGNVIISLLSTLFLVTYTKRIITAPL